MVQYMVVYMPMPEVPDPHAVIRVIVKKNRIKSGGKDRTARVDEGLGEILLLYQED